MACEANEYYDSTVRNEDDGTACASCPDGKTPDASSLTGVGYWVRPLKHTRMPQSYHLVVWSLKLFMARTLRMILNVIIISRSERY